MGLLQIPKHELEIEIESDWPAICFTSHHLALPLHGHHVQRTALKILLLCFVPLDQIYNGYLLHLLQSVLFIHH